jgi:hypothetical protein
MTTVYMLWHVHETEFGDEENKFIGVYSTEAKAREAIEQLKDQPGFKDHPDEFKIYPRTIDRTSWREGFITVAEAMQPKD